MEGFEPIPTSLKQHHLMQIPISQIPIPELPSLESLATHESSHPIPLSTQSLNPRIQTPKVLTMQGVQLPQIPKAPSLPESFSSITKPSSEVTPQQGMTPSHKMALEISSLQGPPQITPEVPLTSKPPLDQGLAQITAENLQKQLQAFNTKEPSTNERQALTTREHLPNQGQAQITPELSTNEGPVQITPNKEPGQFITESVKEQNSESIPSEFLSEQLPEQITVEINPTQANPQMTPQVHQPQGPPLMSTVEITCQSNFQMEQEAFLSEVNSGIESKFAPRKISKSSSTSSLSPSSLSEELSQGLPILTKQNSLESYTKTASGFPHPPKLRLCASELANVRQGLKKVIFGNNPRKFPFHSKQENISLKLSNKRRFSDGSVNIEFKQSFLKELDKRLKEIRLAVDSQQSSSSSSSSSSPPPPPPPPSSSQLHQPSKPTSSSSSSKPPRRSQTSSSSQLAKTSSSSSSQPSRPSSSSSSLPTPQSSQPSSSSLQTPQPSSKSLKHSQPSQSSSLLKTLLLTPSSSSPTSSQSSTEPKYMNHMDTYEDDADVYADVIDVQKWRLLAPWYFHTIDRSAEERLLHNIGLDGTFLVRDSRGHKADHPYTLTVLYHNHIFSVKIRQLVCGHFVLGEEKQDEVKFETVDKLISNYRKKTLLLLGKGGGRVTLSQYPSGF